MTVSIAIMAHPDRAEWAEALSRQTGAVIAWAEPPFATGNGDQSAVWRTRVAALEMAAGDYHCVLQDDAVLCRDFMARLDALCAVLGDRIGMLFYRHKRAYPDAMVKASRSERRGGFATSGMVLGPGLVYPSTRIPDLIAFGSDGSFDGDDPRTKRWVDARGIETWVPLPSLVDHRADAPSLIGHNFPGRRAWRFAA